VRGLDGRPVAGAVLDLWQTDGEGLYEEQRRTAEPWMRGIYKTQPDGSVLDPHRRAGQLHHPDGRPGRRVLQPHRHEPHAPAHIHFAISAPGFHYLVTHLFQKGDEFIQNDVVYGVKDALIVEFVKKPPGKASNGETVDTPFYEVKYDFVLGAAAGGARGGGIRRLSIPPLQGEQRRAAVTRSSIARHRGGVVSKE
jgi:hydroxyquinol 1,2-dioxygenase